MNWLLFIPAGTMSVMVAMMARVATQALLDVEGPIAASGGALILLGFVFAFHAIFLLCMPFALFLIRRSPAFSLTIFLGWIGYGLAGSLLGT
jgi:hypothetical protein